MSACDPERRNLDQQAGQRDGATNCPEGQRWARLLIRPAHEINTKAGVVELNMRHNESSFAPVAEWRVEEVRDGAQVQTLIDRRATLRLFVNKCRWSAYNGAKPSATNCSAPQPSTATGTAPTGWCWTGASYLSPRPLHDDGRERFRGTGKQAK